MKPTSAIECRELGKRYRLHQGPAASYKTLREAMVGTADRSWNSLRRTFGGRGGERPAHESFWALKDVSLEVPEGEVLGIIGRNGAGKSTLLKILSRIVDPTEGYAVIRGRVGSLLEVGTGFHPELSGRENIYLNGAILGMKRSEIARRFDEIVAFAEVETFLDMPIKHYSSGMYLRLAFAVAAHLEPDVLIVDEVLAVGDASFQAKCLGKMGQVAGSGRTVLLVSHNMAAIQNLCDRVALFDRGQLTKLGTAAEVVPAYLGSSGSTVTALPPIEEREGNGPLRFESFRVTDAVEGQYLAAGQSGGPLELRAIYRTRTEAVSGHVYVQFFFNSIMGERLFTCSTRYSPPSETLSGGVGEVRCLIPRLPLVPGTYAIDLTVKIDGRVSDLIRSARLLDVVEGDFFGSGKLPPSSGGSILVDHRWKFLPH